MTRQPAVVQDAVRLRSAPDPRPETNGTTRGTAVVIAAERLFCHSLTAAVERRFTVLEAVTTLGDAERALERHQPALSVLVVDPPFADVPLAEVCRRLVGPYPMTSALLLFRERRSEDLVLACQQGVRALFDTTISAEQLVYGLERVTSGEVVIQQEILYEMMQAPSEPEDGDGHLPLTPTQTRMISLLAEGKTSKEIATLMNVSTASVNHNIERASQRLGTRHRTEAVARAIRLGLIP